MEFMLMPFRRYADFSGRSRRKEYWMYQLFLLIVFVGLFLLMGGFASLESSEGGVFGGIFGILFFVGILATIIPTLAVTVRRLHDQDKSGWWWLIQLIPLGGFVLLVFMFLDGTAGENQYGPDPKNRVDADVFN